ncbi:MAG TPA: hypothetical protein VKW78_13780 [Terriglobales bacterium]|nr:hypothetical protein [Terriglobales bacterium]
MKVAGGSETATALGKVIVKRKPKTLRHLRLVLLIMTAAALSAHAQATLTISAPAALPQFQLTSITTATNNLVIQTNWNFPFGSSHWWSANLSICVYMSLPMTGTGTNTDTIPATAVQVNGSSIVTGGTNCGVPNAYPVVTNSALSFFGKAPSGTTQHGSRSDTLGISISGYPANLESDTYTGTINLIATVQ